MGIFRKNGSGLILIVFTLMLWSCASVPKEVVELSYVSGQDLNAVHASYKTLVQKHFDNLRFQTLTFLETRWIPVYLERFIKKSNLIEEVKRSDPKEVHDYLLAWTE